jgi:hypothetical protein
MRCWIGVLAASSLFLAVAAVPSSAAAQAALSGTPPVSDADIGPAHPNGNGWSAKDYAQVISSGFAGLGGLLAFFVGLAAIRSNVRANEATNIQKTNEAELKAVEDKLSGFYGPYLQLSNTNKLLSAELKSRQRAPNIMRLLLLMLDKDWKTKLTPGDVTLVEEIVDIDKQLLALIHDNARLVSAEVQPYLYRAGAHFRMMSRAYEGKLDNDPARYDAYVYPRHLDRVVELEIGRMNARITLLRQDPMSLHPPAAPLSIPAGLQLPPWPDLSDPSSRPATANWLAAS